MERVKRRGERGQAAITDALLLLIVVTSLTSFLLLFATSYGKGVADQVNRNDSFEFVSSALKTLMYQSVARDASVTISSDTTDPDVEVDYLMALVKEDFADDSNLTLNTQENLAKSVYQVMRPVADSQDYLFAINTAQKYVLVVLWRTNFIPSQDRFGDVQWRWLLESGRVGTTTEAHALVNMVEFQGNQFLLSQDTTETRAGVSLVTWTATTIPDAEWNLLHCSPVSVPGVNA